MFKEGDRGTRESPVVGERQAAERRLVVFIVGVTHLTAVHGAGGVSVLDTIPLLIHCARRCVTGCPLQPSASEAQACVPLRYRDDNLSHCPSTRVAWVF